MSRIENWKIRDLQNGSYDIMGNLYNDKRSEDGTIILTSTIKWINFTDKAAQTKNTLYKLGNPAKEE